MTAHGVEGVQAMVDDYRAFRWLKSNVGLWLRLHTLIITAICLGTRWVFSRKIRNLKLLIIYFEKSKKSISKQLWKSVFISVSSTTSVPIDLWTHYADEMAKRSLFIARSLFNSHFEPFDFQTLTRGIYF